MGRGKGYTINANDIKNMSPTERAALGKRLQAGNNGTMAKVAAQGTAVVRSKTTGNVRYTDASQAGKFNEDNIQ